MQSIYPFLCFFIITITLILVFILFTMIHIPPRKEKVHTKFVVTSVRKSQQFYTHTHISIKSLLIAIKPDGKILLSCHRICFKCGRKLSYKFFSAWRRRPDQLCRSAASRKFTLPHFILLMM